MEVLVDVDAEKSKLAQDLSKIRMVECLDASALNSKDEVVTKKSKIHFQRILLNEAYTKGLCFSRFTQGSLDCAEEDGSDVPGCLQVVDIDSNVQDPQFCSLYAARIYDRSHVAEVCITMLVLF